jgi:hypothetical protein
MRGIACKDTRCRRYRLPIQPPGPVYTLCTCGKVLNPDRAAYRCLMNQFGLSVDGITRLN